MKKMMIALASVALAAVVNAGTVTWGSGALYTAASADGGWSSTTARSASQLVTMSVYLVAADDWATVSTMSQADLYNWSLDKTADYTGSNYTTKYIGAATAKDTAATASTPYQSVVIATYTDSTFEKDFYIANTASGTTSATGMLTMSNLISTPGASTGWQAVAVPEPTSGLLLLLGVAGLALRRKQK